jgi:hypothetical protein
VCDLSNHKVQREEVRQNGAVCRCAVYDADRTGVAADRHTTLAVVPRLLRSDRNRGASESIRKAGGIAILFRALISMGLATTVRRPPRRATT